MWHAIAPLLARSYHVIAYDQRGAGMSSIAPSGYDGMTMAGDLHHLLDCLSIADTDTVSLVGYDMGARTAASFAFLYPGRVRRLCFIEMALAGFGYERMLTPTPHSTLASHWHLALFAVPDAAEWLMKGKEREMLS